MKQGYYIPVEMITNMNYRQMDSDAKVLYCILADIWINRPYARRIDEYGEDYIEFSLANVIKCLGICEKAATRAFVQLEKSGLIDRQRRGGKQKARITVKVLFEEQPDPDDPDTENEDEQTSKFVCPETSTEECQRENAVENEMVHNKKESAERTGFFSPDYGTVPIGEPEGKASLDETFGPVSLGQPRPYIYNKDYINQSTSELKYNGLDNEKEKINQGLDRVKYNGLGQVKEKINQSAESCEEIDGSQDIETDCTDPNGVDSEHRTDANGYGIGYQVCAQIDYDKLVENERYRDYAELAAQIMYDLYTGRIGRTGTVIDHVKRSWEEMKNRFAMLGAGHVKYVIDCIRRGKTVIQNEYAYVMISLFHAPETYGFYKGRMGAQCA